MNKEQFSSKFICFLIICVIGFIYWLIDSTVSFYTYEYNLRSLVFEGPVSFYDTFVLRVPPYQIISRILVIFLIVLTGVMILIYTRYLKRVHYKYKQTIESIPHGIIEVNENGRLLMSNNYFHEMFGFKYPELIDKNIWDILGEDSICIKKDFIESFKGDISPYIWEGSVKTKLGRHVNIEVDWNWRTDVSGNKTKLVAILTDVTEKKKDAKRQKIANKILNYLNEEKDTAETIVKCLDLIKETFFINVAAIRLDREDDFAATALRIKSDKTFPYYKSNGLSSAHLDKEHHCIVSDKTYDQQDPKYRCLCGAVISKTYQFAVENFTEYGTFWVNDLVEFIDNVSQDKKDEVEFHSHCVDAGYRSLALIPLKSQNQVIGLLQLCDRRSGAFDVTTINYFEGLADSIAIAFDRKWAYQRLQISEHTLKSLFDAAPAGVGIVEMPERTLRKVNPYIEKMVGRSAEELLDRSARILYPNDEFYRNVGKDKHPLVEKYGVGSVETKWVNKSGKCIHIILSSAKIENSNELVFTAIDITEKKETEERLIKSEQRYRKLFENMLDGFAYHEIITDENNRPIDYRYVKVNPAFEKLTRLKKEDVEGRTVREILPNVENHWIEEFGKVALTGESSHFEQQTVSMNNRWFEVTAYSPKPRFFAVLFQDVTERREAQEQLKRFEMIVSTSSDLMSFIDSNFIYRAVNHTYEQYHNVTSKDIVGKSVDDLLKDKNTLLLIKENLERCLNGEVISYETDYDFPTMGLRSLEIQYQPYYGNSESVQGIVLNARDITDRKEYETKLSRMFESAPLGLGIANFDRTIVYFNSVFGKMLGYNVDEIRGKKSRIIYPNDYEFNKIGDLYKSDTFRDTGFDITETIISRKDGTVFPALLGISHIKPQNEVVFSIIDITHRKNREIEIAKRKDQFDILISNLFDGFARVSIDGKLISANQTFLDIVGYFEEELLDLTLENITHPDDYVWEKEKFESMLKGEKYGPYTKRYIRKDGEVVHVEVAPYAITDETGKITEIWGIVRDLTSSRRAKRKLDEKEQQLRRVVKMEAVGTLAGGIAHDFNNILQIIGGNVQLMALDATEEKIVEQYKTLTNAVNRGASLVRSLLTFSRKVESNLKPTNINETITVSHKLLDRVALGPVKIDLELILDGNIDRVMADSSQIDQVITNLVLNAKDAMPEGGKITIKTAMIDCDEIFCSAHPDLYQGKHVVIIISDSGTGIDNKYIERIFDPFFTTKEMGKGTGLGLSVVYGIVKNHNGYISCYSEKGIGTEFKVYLPSIGREPTLEEIKEKEQKIVGGNETVLVIDDEAPIRELAKNIFEKYGYKTIICQDGFSGIELYRKHKDEISIVILDLIMPEMSGTEVLGKLIDINPDVKVIVASGYSINGPVKDALDRGAKSFISKPYTLKILLGEVRKILDE